MKILIGSILLLVTAITTVSPTGINGRIFKGIGAYEGEFPYMVRMQTVIKNEPYICGGSLISSNWVLTAAHCVHNPDPFVIYIILGMTYTDKAEIGYALWSPDVVRPHPLFHIESGQHDIALIMIPDTPLCSNIRAVRLPPLNPSQEKSYVGEIGTSAGWGTIGDKTSHPVQLQCGRMQIIDNGFCSYFVPFMGSYQICLDNSKEYSAICPGDSGGPFVLESTGELVGVISAFTAGVLTVSSFELGCPGILTRITPYLEWIKSITGVY